MTADTDTLSIIRDLAAVQFGVEDPSTVDVTAPFDTLGADSLWFLEFLFELEDKLGIPIPQDSVAGVHTLRELAAVVDELLSARTAAAT